MGINTEELMNRREFIRRTGIAALAAGTSQLACRDTEEKTASTQASAGSSPESKIEYLSDVPGISLEVKEWGPVDITDRVRKALTRYTPLPGYEVKRVLQDLSPNQKWYLANRVLTNMRSFNLQRSLDLSSESYVLFDLNANIMFGLNFGDPELVGYRPSDKIRVNRLSNPSDNGVVGYRIDHLDNQNGRVLGTSHVIADYANRKKVIITSPDFPAQVNLEHISDKGNRAVVAFERWQDPGLYLFEVDGQKIRYHNEGRFRAMDYAGSVLVVSSNYSGLHSRVDVATGAETLMWHTGMDRDHFQLSPDGTFCACRADGIGHNSLEVYDHHTGKRFSIDHPKFMDKPKTIGNDGTLIAKSGTYRYEGGKYRLVTAGAVPEDLKIVERK